MKHFGDITKLSGFDLPIVDCITGGSPCQDLSIAGRRAGLDGERSGLFMDQIRIVKEMRERDRASGRSGWMVRPRYMVWENVPGAFSSNGGKDFQAVLTEIVGIVEPESPDVPMPTRGGWSKSGCLYDELGRWSVAWRVHDAQFWGVPQRRKRISLVADFGGLSAPEILFERKGLSGDFEPSGTEREEVAGAAGGGTKNAISFQERAGKPGGGKGILIQHEHVGALSTLNNQSVLQIGCDVYNQEITGGVSASLTAASGGTNTSGPKVLCLNDQGGSVMDITEEMTATLRAQDHGHPPLVAGFKAGQSRAGGIGWEVEQAATLSANCSGTEPTVYDARGNGDGETVPTLTGDHQNRVTDYTALCVGNGQLNQMSMAEQAIVSDNNIFVFPPAQRAGKQGGILLKRKNLCRLL